MEDNFTIMVAKEQGIWAQDSHEFCAQAKSFYFYLVQKDCLIIPDRNDFDEKIKTVYCDIQTDAYEIYGEIMIPHLDHIIDFIDENNINVISLACADETLGEETINYYTNEVVPNLSYSVEGALQRLGLVYSDGDIQNGIVMLTSKKVMPDEQIRMFGDDIYDLKFSYGNNRVPCA